MPRSAGRNTTNPTCRTTARRIPDGTPCGYCFSKWATVWDHLLPWSKRGLTVPSNLYPSCKRCNALLSDLSFPTIQEKREYVRTTLIERGDWNPLMEGEASLSELQEAVYEDSEDAEVLQPSVPQARLGRRSEKHSHVSNLPSTIRKGQTSSKVLQCKVPLAGVAQSKSGYNGLTMRMCRLCRKEFKPKRKDQRFCKPAHRKSFWKYGGLPFDKMKEQIMKDVRKMMQEAIWESVRITDLNNRVCQLEGISRDANRANS